MARTAPSSVLRASVRNASPARVSRTPRESRSNNATPSSASRSRICLDRAGGATRGREHLCGLCRSGAARERRAAAFLAEGLAAGGTCFLAVEPAVRVRVLARLARDWPATRAAGRSERLVIARYARSPAEQLEWWEAGFATAARAVAGELHVVGDVSGGRLGRRGSFDDVLAYERAYEALSRRCGVTTTLCLYDARRLSGVEASRMLQVHADMLRHPAGALVS